MMAAGIKTSEMQVFRYLKLGGIHYISRILLIIFLDKERPGQKNRRQLRESSGRQGRIIILPRASSTGSPKPIWTSNSPWMRGLSTEPMPGLKEDQEMAQRVAPMRSTTRYTWRSAKLIHIHHNKLTSRWVEANRGIMVTSLNRGGKPKHSGRSVAMMSRSRQVIPRLSCKIEFVSYQGAQDTKALHSSILVSSSSKARRRHLITRLAWARMTSLGSKMAASLAMARSKTSSRWATSDPPSRHPNRRIISDRSRSCPRASFWSKRSAKIATLWSIRRAKTKIMKRKCKQSRWMTITGVDDEKANAAKIMQMTPTKNIRWYNRLVPAVLSLLQVWVQLPLNSISLSTFRNSHQIKT